MNDRPNHSQLEATCSKLRQHAFAAERSSGRPLHLVFHVPRCAGQTIHHHLSLSLSGQRYFRVPKRRGAARLFLSKYDLAGMPDAGALDVVGSHWIGRSTERQFPGRRLFRSILLRDPLSQFVSHYNYRMMRYLSQGLRAYPVEIAYRSRRPNFITHFILNTFAEIPWPRLVAMTAAEKYAAANVFLSEFDFVGDHTRCSELIDFLAKDLGISTDAALKNSSSQWLEKVAWEPVTEKSLSPSMLASFRRDNELDQLLWETWREPAKRSMNEPAFTDEPHMRRLSRQASRLLNQMRRRIRRRWTGPGLDA